MFFFGESCLLKRIILSLLRIFSAILLTNFYFLASLALFPDIDVDIRAVALVGSSPQVSLEVPSNNKNNG